VTVAFFLKPSPDNKAHHSTLYLSQHGSELQPAYELQHPDPALPASKNCYAVGICDSFSPEVVFGEVLVKPEWTQPTLNAEEIRKNNGIPPPPQAIMPKELVIQLYNPEQQVKIVEIPGSWNTKPSYEFEMPLSTFRQPSASALDRSRHDPAGNHLTPKISFRWKRVSKLNKDMVCIVGSKSTSVETAKERKGKDPDITVAILENQKEITIYEPNVNRLDMEDPKGLECVLLLGAIAVRDVFLGGKKNVFNVDSPDLLQKNSVRVAGLTLTGQTPSPPHEYPYASGANPWRPPPQPVDPTVVDLRRIRPPEKNGQSPANAPPQVTPPPQYQPNPLGRPVPAVREKNPNKLPRGQNNQQAAQTQHRPGDPPPPDPMAQWRLDAEQAQLRQQIDAEENRLRQKAAIEQKERERKQAEETRKTQKLLEREAREKQKRDAEVAKETERLKKIYEKEQRDWERSRGRNPQPTSSSGSSGVSYQSPRPQSHPQAYQRQSSFGRPNYQQQPNMGVPGQSTQQRPIVPPRSSQRPSVVGGGNTYAMPSMQPSSSNLSTVSSMWGGNVRPNSGVRPADAGVGSNSQIGGGGRLLGSLGASGGHRKSFLGLNKLSISDAGNKLSKKKSSIF
jgi:hypothetical protein